jgi:predicted DNA-binding protein
MAKKDNKSVLPISTFGEINTDKAPEQMGLESLGIKNRSTKGAAAGCKPGSIRHTYVMPLEMISKLKAIAGYFGKPEVGIVLEILQKGIADYEALYGSCVSDINRGNG